MTNSPRKRPGVFWNLFNSSDKVPRSTCSFILVNSLATDDWRSPKVFKRSDNVRSSLSGDSSSRNVTESVTRVANVRRRAVPLLGKKPAKKNLSGASPADTSAVIGAEGPGNAMTDTLAFIASSTSLYPGSDIRGVPESDTKAMEAPSMRD